ncbi:hypothetical protein HOLleu_24979 [Holothuria leucospilota]|uniref:Uncharacterized protein n=1 Tax=Holothuria leucospilota TaxID=206669 RepID=A0A9Q1BS59_HOLLE|nr:hypothetical protein HOLleu_24979 [Holothuria leucospilota]
MFCQSRSYLWNNCVSKRRKKCVTLPVYKSSYTSSSTSQVLVAKEGDKLEVKCSKEGVLNTDCTNLSQEESSCNFTVLSEHHLCFIVCNMLVDNGLFCSVNITLHISKFVTCTKTLNVPNEVSTLYRTDNIAQTGEQNMTVTKASGSVTNMPGQFPVFIFATTLVVCVMICTLIACFYVSKRCKSTSLPHIYSQTNSSNTNVDSNSLQAIGPTCKSVIKSPEGQVIRQETFVTQHESDEEGFYHDINDDNDVNKKNYQACSTQVGTFIVEDFYSEVKNTEDMNIVVTCDTPSKRSNEKDKVNFNKESFVLNTQDEFESVWRNRLNEVVEQPQTLEYETIPADFSSPEFYAILENDEVE